MLAGGDLLVSSQTGSGKTAAFVLPGLQRLRTAAKIPGNGPAHAGARADARARDAGAEGDARLLQRAEARHRAAGGRHAVRAAARAAEAAASTSSIATPGPPQGPHGPRQRGPRARRAPGAGRGRPDARHGLPGGDRLDRRARAEGAPDAALLGDARRRGRQARRARDAQPEAHRDRAGARRRSPTSRSTRSSPTTPSTRTACSIRMLQRDRGRRRRSSSPP